LCPALERIVLKCLKREAAARHATAGAVADDLARWLDGAPPLRPRRLFLAGVTCLTAALAVPAALLLSGRPRRPDASPTAPLPPTGEMLIGSRGPPAAFRWAAGQEHSSTWQDRRDGAFVLQAAALALLELRPTPPSPSFRFHAEVRHDSAPRGEVGLYLAYRLGEQGGLPAHAFYRLAFADKEEGKLDLGPGLWTNFLRRERAGLDRPVGAPARPPRFRQFGLDITAGEIKVLWETVSVLTMSLDELGTLFRGGGGFPALTREALVSGSVGLYVYAGRASYRRVELKTTTR